ncbi:hypothetical protein CPB86DRAFT_804233 [Serendipita vermifera]|nr:hypothetical protein CPB86DRAFT_804233 [Serendipita vermifera]
MILQLLWLASIWLGRSTVSAQSVNTTAVCSSEFEWMNNPRGQSPCLVAAYLQGACGTGAWTVPLLPLTPDGQQQTYLAPNNATRNLCTCASAVYNLMSACAACQGGGWILFAPWALSCEEADLLSVPDAYPRSIPVNSATEIPTFAMTDPRAWANGGFNVTQARQVALGASPPTLSVTSTSTSTSPSSSTSSSTGSSSSSTSAPAPSRDNTGPIVGGVVGGLLGLALVVVILVWLLCGKRIRQQFETRRQKQVPEKNVLGRAFTTPQQPPALANIVVPVPIRSYPARPTFQTYGSSGSQTTNVDPNYGYTTLHSPKPSEDPHNYGSEDHPIDRIEMGSNLSRQNTRRTRHRSSSSSGALALLTRITSLRWRRHVPTNSDGSAGSGTMMTSTGMISSEGAIDLDGSRRGSNENQQGNTYRRMVVPVPFTLPNHAEEPDIIDISNPDNPRPEGPNRSQSQSSSYPSAAEEKRRLNPPAYTGPPAAVVRRETVGQEISMAPRASLARLEISSGVATAGSRTVASESQDGHGPLYSPYSDDQRSGQPERHRPHSDSRTHSNSVPSNIALPSPWEQAPQTASSGVLDYSPVPPESKNAKSVQTPSNLRFTVTNPGHHVEM